MTKAPPRRWQTCGGEFGHQLTQQRGDLIARLRCGGYRGLLEAALAGSVRVFVNGIEWTQNGAGARIDKIDVGEIPASVT